MIPIGINSTPKLTSQELSPMVKVWSMVRIPLTSHIQQWGLLGFQKRIVNS